MEGLGLEMFLSGPQDLELRQYRILRELKELRGHFAHSRLYPHLAVLIRLAEELQEVLANKGNIDRSFPRRLRGLDLETHEVVNDPVHDERFDIDQALELIAWALPVIGKVIEEGVEIYNFVDEHIVIEQVGILPAYRLEGYWFVPDVRAGLLHVFRYQVSLFTSSREQYRSLRSVLLESLAEGVVKRPRESVKLELLKKYPDLPTSATYECEVDLDFPYAETLLPVAKRKLMARLVA
ncbi:MAG: hypothetical protein AB1428_12650 [Bacteroidota bacterium]